MSSWSPGPLPGVLRRALVPHSDDRGVFTELWRSSWTEGLPGAPAESTMRQANLSLSLPGVLRGLHLHGRQADLWLVVEGHPFVGLVDVRPMLVGSGPAVVGTLEAVPGDAIYIPEGVAHGFLATDPLTLIYLVTNEYDASDELGFRWDDPAVAVPWPNRSPLLSERDAAAPTLDELIASMA